MDENTLQELQNKIIMLESDIYRAIGHMQGCGHPDKYLENKYPLPETQEKGQVEV